MMTTPEKKVDWPALITWGGLAITWVAVMYGIYIWVQNNPQFNR